MHRLAASASLPAAGGGARVDPTTSGVGGGVGFFDGAVVMIVRMGCLAGAKRHAKMCEIVASRGGRLTEQPSEATHLVVDEQLDAETAVDELDGMRSCEWPRIHTEMWVPRCSQKGRRLEAECLHHSHVE